MKKWLKHRFALTDAGVKSVIVGSGETAIQNISYMLPVGLLFLLIKDMLNDTFQEHTMIYLIGGIVCLVFIYMISYFQYNETYLATYVETGKRRINLAEKLRKIPLSFFEKRDLADLTTSIMNDCDVLEQSQSHFVPPLIGSMLSTAVMAISLFALNWKLALAVFWVLPISFIVIISSSKMQNTLSAKTSAAKIEYEAGVQECIEVTNDLHANNAEEAYLHDLVQKIKNYEKSSVMGEFGKAAFIACSSLILRLGIATVILTGANILRTEEIDLLMFIFFALVASRIYDPLDSALQHLAILISTNRNIERMNEIMEQKMQSGHTELTNQGYDMIF